MKIAKVALQEQIKCNLQNYIQVIFEQIMQNTGTYQLNVEGEITSLGTALSQDIRRMRKKLVEHLDPLRRNVSGRSVEDDLRKERQGETRF